MLKTLGKCLLPEVIGGKKPKTQWSLYTSHPHSWHSGFCRHPVCRVVSVGDSEHSTADHQEKLPVPPHSAETVVHGWFCSLELPEARGFTMSGGLFELPVPKKFKSIGLASGKGIYTGHDMWTCDMWTGT